MLLKLIPEYESLVQDAIIDDDFELGRYYSYWLTKAYQELLLISSDNKEKYKTVQFENHLNYIGIEIIEFYHRFQKGLISVNTLKQMQLLFNQISSKIYGLEIEFRIIGSNSKEYLELLYEKLEINDFNLEISKDFIFDVQKIIASIEVITVSQLRFYLYQESMINYLISSAYYLLLECYTYNILSSFNGKELLQKINTVPDLLYAEFYQKMIECAEIGLKYFPENYLIYRLFSTALIPSLKNNIHIPIHNLDNISYQVTGRKLIEEKQFEEANKEYLQGIKSSSWGNRFVLYNHLAVNQQGYAEYENPKYPLEEYLDISLYYAKKSIFDLRISIDQAFFSKGKSSLFIPIEKYYFSPCLEGEEEHMRTDLFLKSFSNHLPSKEAAPYVFANFNIIGLSYKLKSVYYTASIYYTKGIDYFFSLKPDMDSRFLYHHCRNLGDLFNNRGLLYLNNIKDHNNALKDFHSAFEYYAENSDGVKLNITACYLALEDFSSAISFAERIINETVSEKVKYDAIFNEILACYYLPDISMIEPLADKYFLMNPEDSELLLILGKIYKSIGKINKSKEYFEAAEKKGQFSAFYYLGEITKDEEKQKHIEKYIISSINYIRKISFSRNINRTPLLYKYKSINKNTLQTLVDEYIYFTDIFNLNDPFDCRMIQEYAKDDDYREVFKEIGEPRIFSLSRISDNDLLWSHYADQHKGISIGYSFNYNQLLNNDIYIFDVDYKKIAEYKNNLLRSRVSDTGSNRQKSLSEDASLLNDIIFKKDIWEYEKEVRLFHFGLAGNNKKYNVNNLYKIESIIFGCRTPEADIETVLNIMKSKAGTNSEIKNNTLLSDRFNLKFKKMKRSDKVVFGLEYDASFILKG